MSGSAARHDKSTTAEPDCTCPSDQPVHEDACPQRQYLLARQRPPRACEHEDVR